MKPELKKMLKSMVGGTVATMIFIVSSYTLDEIMNAKLSNAIALIIGAICNFFMQHKAFLNTTNANADRGWKFFISEFLVLGSSQLGVNYLLDNKKNIERELEKHIKYLKKYEKYYNTFIRLFITGIVFIFISFPIRRYWVFND